MTASLSTIQAALEQRLRPRIARQQNRAAVTLDIIPKTPGKGKNVAFDVSVGTQTGTYFDDGEDVGSYTDDTEVPATLAWSEVGDAFAVTGRAEDAASGDATELSNLFMHKLGGAINRTASKLNVEVISGVGTAAPQKILGLLASAGPLDATGIYAGVNRATYPQFAGNVLANGGVVRTPSVKLLEDGCRAAGDASGEAIDFYITTPLIWQILAEKLCPDRRYPQAVSIRGQKITLDGGFDAIEHNGKPIFKDKDWTAGTLVGLNADHFGLEYLPVAPQRVARGDVLAMLPIMGTAYELNDGTPNGGKLMAALYKLARNGNKSRFQLLVTCQLWCDRPGAHFLLKDLASN